MEAMIRATDNRERFRGHNKKSRMSISLKWPIVSLIGCCVTLVAACTACETTPNHNSAPSMTPIQTPIPITSAVPPSILYSGEITLEANYPPEIGYSSADIQQASFDFDTNKNCSLEVSKKRSGIWFNSPQPRFLSCFGPIFWS